MPVWGRNRFNRAGKRQIISPEGKRLMGKVIISDPNDQKKKKIVRPKKSPRWMVFHSSLQQAEQRLSFPIQDWVRRRIQTQQANHAKEPVRVMEWGCGAGESINQLARAEREAVTYGYDHKHFRSWTRNTRVAFIQESPERILRYFKDGSLDLIYSNFGLIHYLHKMDLVPMVEYLSALSHKLKIGGAMILHYPSMSRTPAREFKQLLSQHLAGMRIQTGAHEPPGRPTLLIERTK